MVKENVICDHVVDVMLIVLVNDFVGKHGDVMIIMVSNVEDIGNEDVFSNVISYYILLQNEIQEDRDEEDFNEELCYVLAVDINNKVVNVEGMVLVIYQKMVSNVVLLKVMVTF